MICYQCDSEVDYLFDDGRCKDCTQLTPEEVRGDDTRWGNDWDGEGVGDG